jgi:hypothetical protein
MLREVEDLAGPFEGWCGGKRRPGFEAQPRFRMAQSG